MKKSVILVAILITAISLLPIVGNSFMKTTIDERLLELKGYGLETKRDEASSNYLNSSRHFEFFLKDSQAFTDFLRNYSQKQIPPYVNAMVAGALIGVDVEYGNLPFAKQLSVEIYPLELSPNFADSLKDYDIDFYKFVDGLLKSKSVAYHINYNMINKNFDGFIKDLNENYAFKDGAKLSLDVSGAIFKGKGRIVAPDRISSSIKRINFNVQDGKTNLTLNMLGLSGSSNFESANTYLSSADLASLELSMSASDENLSFEALKIKVNVSSNAQGDKVELDSKSSAKEFSFRSSQGDVKIQNFRSDFALDGLDKAAFEKLTHLASRANNAQSVDKELFESAIDLIAKGLEIKIPELSVNNVALNGSRNLKGFELRSDIRVIEDKDLISKINISPILASENIDMELKIKLSAEIYAELLDGVPLTSVIENYAKQDGENVVFNITFKDEKLRINEKIVR
jgi:hypothetical protein